MVGRQNHTSTRFLYDEYRKYLLCLYPQYSADEYLERKIYSKDEQDVQLNALDVLLREKSVLVLGEKRMNLSRCFRKRAQTRTCIH